MVYDFNNDLKDDLYHEGIIALINAYNTYKEESNINSLPIEDKNLICSLYGINTKKITQKELSKILKYSQSYISKKHKIILNKIKDKLIY